jgi:hypothetical protein
MRSFGLHSQMRLSDTTKWLVILQPYVASVVALTRSSSTIMLEKDISIQLGRYSICSWMKDGLLSLLPDHWLLSPRICTTVEPLYTSVAWLSKVCTTNTYNIPTVQRSKRAQSLSANISTRTVTLTSVPTHAHCVDMALALEMFNTYTAVPSTYALC